MPVTLIRFLLLWTIVFAKAGSTFAEEVALWGRFETAVENSRNPFRDVVFDAVFMSPTGRTVKFFGYYDGNGQGAQDGHVWKLRFMPDEAGRWSYDCSFSDGSPGQQGRFRCVADSAKPGPLRIDGTEWRFADGTEFFPRSYYFSEAFSGKSPYWESRLATFFGDQYQLKPVNTSP